MFLRHMLQLSVTSTRLLNSYHLCLVYPIPELSHSNVLSIVDDVRRALSFSRRLPHGITVTSDRTTNQRQSLRALRAQAEQHNARNPGHPMEVRYVDNIPKLVEVNSHASASSLPRGRPSLASRIPAGPPSSATAIGTSEPCLNHQRYTGTIPKASGSASNSWLGPHRQPGRYSSAVMTGAAATGLLLQPRHTLDHIPIANLNASQTGATAQPPALPFITSAVPAAATISTLPGLEEVREKAD